MDKIWIYTFLTLLSVATVCADLDSYFSIGDNSGYYTANPGDNIIVKFSVSNRDEVYPENVTVYINPCPSGWSCQKKVLSYHSTGVYAENLSIKLPLTASPKKYTFYILLGDEAQTKRGNDRVLLDVLSPDAGKVVPYTEYDESPSESSKNPALSTVAPAVKRPVVEERTVIVEDAAELTVPKINATDVVENVERMEANKQFMEYVSVVLIVVLIFIAAGAYMALRKNHADKDDKKK